MKRSASVLAMVFSLAAPRVADAQALSREQQAEFLRTAKIVRAAPIGKGVTRPFRLTLSNGTTTHDAAFQSVDEQRRMSNTGPGRRPELNFADSWRFNVAASRVAALIGIGHMVPVAVERTWKDRNGALTWWVDDVLMDDEGRRKSGAAPPDEAEWARQQATMRVFTELVYDTDRNQGNILITKDWQLVMIDFTRAFRPWKTIPDPIAVLRRCRRPMLEGMRRLTKETMQAETGDYLSPWHIDALLARRDLIVRHFDELIAQIGEAQVLY